MNIALLKSKTENVNITAQQNYILKYAKSNGLGLDSTEIENSSNSIPLDERRELKGFLRSLCKNDNLLIYDMWTLSDNMEELIKILECLLKRNISLYICSVNSYIEVNSTPLELLNILVKYEKRSTKTLKDSSRGRPNGRMSKSKFDIYRVQVIEELEKGSSVSLISRKLEVSRTSLKDYINSRGLKELVIAKKELLHTNSYKKPIMMNTESLKECSLINKKGI